MAKKTKQEVLIDIKVQYKSAIEGMAECQAKIKALKNQIKDLKDTFQNDKSSESYKKSLKMLNVEVKAAQEQMKMYEKAIMGSILSETAHESSLNSLRSKLVSTTKEFDNLSKAERESAKGTALLTKMKNLQLEINKAEKASKDLQTNLGSYKNIDSGLMELLKAVNPQVGTLVEKIQSSEIATNLLGKAQNNLAKSFGLSKAAAGGLAQIGLVILSMIVSSLIEKYKEWREEQEKIAQQARLVKENVNEAMLDGAKNAKKEQVELRLLYKATQNVNKSNEERLAAAKELQRRYPKYFENMSTEEILAGKGATAYDNLTKSILKTARARAAADKIVQNEIKILELEEKRTNLLAKKKEAEDAAKVTKGRNSTNNVPIPSFGLANAAASTSALIENKSKDDAVERYNKLIKSLNIDIQLYKDANKKLEKSIDNANVIFKEGPVEDEKPTTPYSSSGDLTKEEEARRMKTIQETTEYEINQKAKAAREIADDENKSYEERVASLIEFYAQQELLTREQEAAILLDTELTAEEISLIKQKSKDKQIELQKNSNKELADLLDQHTQKEKERVRIDVENKLATVKKGSEEELTLKLQQLEAQRLAEVEAAKKTGADVEAINEKYRKQEVQARETHNATLNNQRQIEWQNQIMQAQLDGQDTLTMRIEQKKAEINSLRQLEDETDVEYMNRKLQLEQEKEALEKEATAKRYENLQKTFDGIKAVGAGLEDLFGAWAEESAAMASFNKAMALFNIGVASAEAIANAVKAAKGGTAFDYVAQIGVAVGAVMTNVAKAKKLLNSEKAPKASTKSADTQKKAEGGLITGPGSGTSDDIPAMLSNGESVLTARATSMFSPILSAFNQLGGGVPFSTGQVSAQVMGEEMLARAFSRAVAQMPNPVVSVEEINNTDARVQVVDNYRAL
ncbi:hypothetical protein M2132_000827 [Dysgonomonas sp. PH5-45]|uniref:hypothetical protein n=1 Tax=unclassified Dysgonomonas TaxID=2630389 RepID=UPI002474CA30|nr:MULTISPECIES: hypothetical protein [unclassified Dysgonomonas]MDH6354499.1 hypothetical protein [Dysgonomonas sp. PH5-45]MDH6387444.1 hypothetical protein [Dysgonomonas sp. PH5-37]